MKKAEILLHMRGVRAAWQAAVDRIPLDRMDEPMGNGPWSAKDEIVHVTFYDRRLAGRLAALARGDDPRHEELCDHPAPMPAFEELNSFNEAIRRRYAGMSAEEIVAASRRAFDDLVAAIWATPDDAWNRPAEFSGQRTLAAFMPGTTRVHYARHLPPLEMFIMKL